MRNSFRARLLSTVPHLHFPLGFAHLGKEGRTTWHRLQFGDGGVLDVMNEQCRPTMAAMIRAAARIAVRGWLDRIALQCAMTQKAGRLMPVGSNA